MTTTEHIITILGVLIIIGSFVYGIYDSYFHDNRPSSKS